MATVSTIMIAVAGGSGSGKTTFARSLQTLLGDHVSGIVAQDAYYRDMHTYFDRDGGQVNFDHPDSIEFELMIEHLAALKKGADVAIPKYDFKTHSRLAAVDAFPHRPIVILDGILLLTQTELRPLLDFAYFIDTPEEVRYQRRLKRDVVERGRTPEGVHAQFFHHVKPMHDLFVEPSRKFADRVISGEQDFASVIKEIVSGLNRQRASLIAN